MPDEVAPRTWRCTCSAGERWPIARGARPGRLAGFSVAGDSCAVSVLPTAIAPAVPGTEADHGQAAEKGAREGRRLGSQGLPRLAEAAIELRVGRQRRPFVRGARKPVEEFLRQIARFNGLREFLRDIRFSENNFHFHRGNSIMAGGGASRRAIRS